MSWVAAGVERNPLMLAVPVAVALAFGIYFAARSRGYFSDEGSFCTIAQGILHGRLPYRDLFNEKPPLQYFWTAAIMAVSQPTLAGARLASTLALILVFSCILHRPAEQIRSPLSFLAWTILAFLIAMNMLAFNNTAESSLAALFSLNALLLHRGALAEAPANRVVIAQGFLSGISIGFRQAAILPALLLMFPPNRKFSKKAYCLGLVAGLLCWLAPLYALGIGSEFFSSTVGFQLTNPGVLAYLRGPALADAMTGLLWLLCLGWLISLRKNDKGMLWLVFWVTAISVSAFFRMDGFRLWPSVAAALVLISQEEPEENLVSRIVPLAIASAALLALVGFHPKRSSVYTDLASAITQVTTPRDRIWVGPFHPLSYCLAGRQPASRYYFILPWTAKARVRRQIVADIGRTQPRLIILNERDPPSVAQLMPQLLRIVATRYHVIRTYGSLVFYQRNSLGG